MAEQIKCARCGEKREALGYAPFPNEVGQRIGSEICQQCWKEWLARQNMIINHYGLDLMNEAAATVVGEHDFSGFQASGGKVRTTVRTIESSAWSETPLETAQTPSRPVRRPDDSAI